MRRLLALLLALFTLSVLADEIDGHPVLNQLPRTPDEFRLLVRDIPSLQSLAGGEAIYAGYHEILLGDTLPLGPAPHVPWATPLPGGKLRVTAISPIRAQYDLGEIERRLDCEMRHIQVLDQYHGAKNYPDAMEGYLTDQALATLAKPADVLLLGQNVRLFPPRVAQAILAKVEAGCGAVVMGGARYGGGNQYAYWPLRDKIPAWEQFSQAMTTKVDMGYKKFVTVTDHQVESQSVFASLPWELLPTHYLFKGEAAPESTVLATDQDVPMAFGGRWGEGRAMLLMWVPVNGAFPIAEDNQVPPIPDYQEYHAAALIRALLWAAGREQPLQPRLDDIASRRAAAELPAATNCDLNIQLDGQSDGRVRADVRLLDLRGTELMADSIRVANGIASVELPPLPAGRYRLDVICRDGAGNSVGFGAFVLTVIGPGKLAVQQSQDRYLVGEPAVITAVATDLPAGKATAVLRFTDALGRVLVDSEQPLAGGKATWTVPTAATLAVVHYADVEIRLDGEALLKERAIVYVPRFQPTDFTGWLWPGSRPGYAQDRIFDMQRQSLGFDVIMAGGYGGAHSAINFNMLTSGCLPFYSNIAYLGPLEMEKDPVGTRKKAIEMATGSAKELRLHGGLAMFFQDERHGRGDSGTPTPEALAVFRQWLAKRYRDIAELNQVWRSNFASFDEVVPQLTKQFNPWESVTLAPWLEWRLWALDEVVETDRQNAALIREAVGAPCNLGLEGIFGLSGHNIPYGGTDLAAQSEFFNVAGPYGEHTLNACRHFFPDFQFSWAGYSQSYAEYQRYVWSCVFQGHVGLGYWYGPCFVNARDCFYPQAEWLRELNTPAYEGIGKLLVENRPQVNAPIAFLYSQSSLYATASLGQGVDPENPNMMVRPAAWGRQSLQQMLQDAGVQFTFRSEKELQADHGKGLKLLICSTSLALEPATCRALEAFVNGGGVVLADLCPGVWDNRGGYHSPGQLDTLFGVKRDQPFHLSTMVSEWNVGVGEAVPEFNLKGQWYNGQYYEDTLLAGDGQALGKHWFGPYKPPALVFKRTGQGATVLMNWIETEYRRVPEHWQVTLTNEVFRLAGIEPRVTMRDHIQRGAIINTKRKVFQWQDGQTDYWGVLMEDGKFVDFELPRAGQVYELIRGGVYLGEGKTVSVDLRDQPFALLAVLPYRVGNLEIKGGRCRLGEALPVSVELGVGRPAAKHVVHLKVLRPDGSEYGELSRNVVLVDGKWSGTLPVALNDPDGTWEIEAREVVSGQTAKTRCRVRD